jgi:hypothetical protein
MARSQVNGAYPVVLVTALLSLIHPFYSGKHELSYPLLRMFRVDIFWFLAKALCSFYALLDLPLICLFMAQQSVGLMPCLSDRMRLALCYQTIAVHYGHWQAADGVYNEWNNKIPPASWLYEELTYNSIVGLLWRMENLLAELYINNVFHKACPKTCKEKYVLASLATLKQLHQKLNDIAYSTAFCQSITQEKFQENMQIVRHLHEYYTLTIRKIENESLGESDNEILMSIGRELSKGTEFNISRHLTPFLQILPYNLCHKFFWGKLVERITSTTFRTLQSFSLLDNPKTYADRLFSLIVSMLYHDPSRSFSHVIQTTLTAYLKSTAGRHYRIPLIRKLLQVYQNPLAHQLNPEPDEPIPHFSLPQEKVNAVNMTLKDIQDFSFTVQDARNNFANIELCPDEKFIMYMKKRDILMSAWIDLGLDGIRFADCL